MAYATKFWLAVQTHQGMVRKNNEDSFAVTRPGEPNGNLMSGTEPFNLEGQHHPGNALERVVITVADGMGGTNAGEVAARIAVETINEVVLNTTPATPVKTLLLDAIEQANKKIIDYSQQHPLSSGMGTTVVLAAVDGYQIHIAWIGDSRAYLFNPETGLTQLSKDHSLVQELVDMKQLTMEEAFYHPDSNIITQSLGEPDRVLDPGFLSTDFKDEDVLVLCSDGLNCMLQDSEIGEIIRSSYHLSAAEIAAQLIKVANDEGGQDNTTVAVYQRERVSEAVPAEQSEIPVQEVKVPENPEVPAFAVSQAPQEIPKPSLIRRIRRPLLLLILIVLAGGVWWKNEQAAKEKRAEAQRAQLLYQQDSIKKAQDSLTIIQHEKDSIQAKIIYDSVEALVHLQITSNSTDSLSAINLVTVLKEDRFDAVCDCKEPPYQVFIRLLSQEAADSLTADFPLNHKGLIKKYKLIPKQFAVMVK